MKLYHYSNTDNIKELNPKLLGANSYTSRDYSYCSLPRVYFYVKPKPELCLIGSKYLYLAEINDVQLYDGIKDPLNVFAGYDLNKQLRQIKALGYRGLIFRTYNCNAVISFYKIKVKKNLTE